MLCGDTVEVSSTKVYCAERCGDFKTVYLGETKKKYPCDDCIDDKKWIMNANGKWIKA